MKTRANLMHLNRLQHQAQLMHKAPRCSAKSKRSGCRCRAPAVKGRSVCRMHGARAGAPKGKANGAWEHGRQTNEAVSLRRRLLALIRVSREMVRQTRKADDEHVRLGTQAACHRRSDGAVVAEESRAAVTDCTLAHPSARHGAPVDRASRASFTIVGFGRVDQADRPVATVRANSEGVPIGDVRAKSSVADDRLVL